MVLVHGPIVYPVFTGQTVQGQNTVVVYRSGRYEMPLMSWSQLVKCL